MKHPTALWSVSRETAERLAAYEDLLLRWNRRINLVSRGDAAAVATRHIQDSLQLVPLVPPRVDRAIDMGSGAGFPGLIVAMATGIHFDLIEADQRKAAFLREAVRVTGAPASVHAVRLEEAAVRPAALVTARALAPLVDLLALACPFMATGGVALFPKGADVDRELTDATARWQMRVERFPSATDARAAILRISEVRRG